MRTLQLSLAVVLLAAPIQASACSATDTSCEGGPSLWFAISIGTSSLAAVPGVVTVIGNGVAIARGTQASRGWFIAGLVSAGLNFAASGVALVPLIANGSLSDTAQLMLAVSSFVIGAADLALALVGHLTGAPELATLLPRPLLLQTPGHELVLGLSSPTFRF